MQPLKKDKIKIYLQKLDGWHYENNSIQKMFVLKDFSSAVSMVVRIGFVAEKNDHHPEVLLHGWNKLTVKLSTHEANGVTSKDFKLAHRIEELQ